ncbi:MAG: SDR family oxidoreductase [Acidobacteria bacterium]|nr:SDR family oxidoreductase [Acidobacteriota bacterium]
MSQAQDPRTAGPKPPFPDQEQEHPGTERKLDPPVDHGEQSYVGHGRLQDRTAIVTGGDSGIGRAIAICFAKEGADIVLSYLPEEERDAKEVEAQVEKAGRKIILHPGDIGDKNYAQSLVSTAMDKFGKIDIVVNNAAFQMSRKSMDEIPEDEFEHTYRTNIFGLYYITKAAMPKMKPGGVILNTTSIQTFRPSGELLAYAGTKAAIANMTKGLAQLGAKNGIRVNAVAPGPVWTPLIPSTMPPEKVKNFGSQTLFERPAQPVELARIFVFLASDEATFISGEIYAATGGPTPL